MIYYLCLIIFLLQHAIVIDTLIHHPCVKEEDLLEHLKFERRQLRALINTLKTDKFIKSRMIVETDSEDITTKHNYYFINYSTFVNVIKVCISLIFIVKLSKVYFTMKSITFYVIYIFVYFKT